MKSLFFFYRNEVISGFKYRNKCLSVGQKNQLNLKRKQAEFLPSLADMFFFFFFLSMNSFFYAFFFFFISIKMYLDLDIEIFVPETTNILENAKKYYYFCTFLML